MKDDDPILTAWADATNCYLAGAGLPPLNMAKRACSICRAQPASFDDDICPDCARAVYADEREPDRRPSDDERLDDPRHDQCRNGRFEQ